MLKMYLYKSFNERSKRSVKKAKDEVTEFYKALKSLLDNIKTLRKEYDIADFTKEFDLIVEKERSEKSMKSRLKHCD